MPPLISVLLVACNAGEYLAESVRSILTQSHSGLELILVDNHSTHSSVVELAQGQRDPRLKIVSLAQNVYHNGGLIAGLPHCQGNYIAVMDADDVALPTRLEQQLAWLERDASLTGVGCAAQTIDQQGTVAGREFTLCDRQEIKCYAQFEMPFVFPTLMARRQLFEDFPFRSNLPMAHDLDLLARSSPTHAFACVPEVLFHYRRHPNSTTSSRAAALMANASVVRLATARRHAGKPERFDILVAEKDALLKKSPSINAVFDYYGRQALAEGFFQLAIWHARKAAVAGAGFKGLRLILSTLLAGQYLPAAEFRFLFRLARLGTVRAYQLHPLRP